MSRKIRAEIGLYVNGFILTMRDGMNCPSPSDCFYCQGAERLGDPHGHLIQHLADGYYVPSLAYNAVKEAEYPHPGIILGSHGQHFSRMGGTYMDEERVRAALVNYLTKRLVTPIKEPAA